MFILLSNKIRNARQNIQYHYGANGPLPKSSKQRTNNTIESWHAVFARRSLQSHEVIPKVDIKREQDNTECLIAQLIKMENKSRPKSKNKDNALKDAFYAYTKGLFCVICFYIEPLSKLRSWSLLILIFSGPNIVIFIYLEANLLKYFVRRRRQVSPRVRLEAYEDQ